ncbi:hypothetical protein TH53_21950 [Pedobacter lusitanus]|uniref:DHCW motif cupin fold protein n=1 Tax=Pedobacter lusitanus TaxID=1503925 RepID=A0A0D0GCY4_9SPHI|nr:DHCW motif cupin fold protein [Pedobacter lusitanus]KIO75197.1 hypothetical protein TH53_21950 [Pedobacter lusitanus]
MDSGGIAFENTDWENIPATRHNGETGFALWKTIDYGDLRIRVVEYSKNYKADHWCSKGHVIYCIEGEMVSELADGSEYKLTKGMSYQVSDELSSHRTYSEQGVKLFIVDGSFLGQRPEKQ